MVAQLRDKLAATSGNVQASHHLKTLKHVFKVATEWAFPKGREADRFTFNYLRSKSASDTAELAEASARLGHTTTAVTKRHYIRKPAKVKPLR